ncbi:hypothetical protein TRVL_08412 [Trypanosoma vivax]|nr:hypothetical protein TRVL_08412 [Trypanosoma vivax]
MVYAAGVCDGALPEHYFFLKAVRWKLSKLNGGLLRLGGAAIAPTHVSRTGGRRFHERVGRAPVEGWRGGVCGGRRVAAGATLHPTGRGACRDTGAQFLCRSYAEKSTHFIGNATAVSTMKKGSAHSTALVRGPSLIDRVLQQQCVHTSCDCIASAKKPADGISRGNRFRSVDIAKGWWMRRRARRAR